MKVLIIILIILICLIIIKSSYESFKGETTKVDIEDINKLLKANGLMDNNINDKLDEYKQLIISLEKNKLTNINGDITKLKRRYNNTKIQLENILFNKFRPNRLNFNDKQHAFKLKLNSFINDNNGHKLKITNYGSIDTARCGNKWRLPDNVPPINNKKPYFDKNTKCCTPDTDKDDCISQYKKNVNLYNEYKLVLKNQNNKHLELNKIKDNIYIVNLNSQILEYNPERKPNYDITPILGTFQDVINQKISVCFKVLEIIDLIHLNQYITKDHVIDKLIEYPLYLIVTHTNTNTAITIHGKTDLEGEKLSIQPLSKEMIKQQIFYKN